MDSLGALSAFVQVADARSFTVAGRKLGVSSSAVGKAVARLEERLGVRLFHRSTRSITLTAEGALFLDRCRRIFGEIEAAELELAQATAAPRGKLRVSLPLAGTLMLSAITQFMRAYPDIELELDFTDRLVDVIEEGFDAVIRSGGTDDSRLMMRTLGSFGYRVVGTPEYFARHGTPRTPEDLKSHACLLHRFPSTGKLARWPLKRGRTRLELELPMTIVATTIDPLIFMAEQGLGVTCVPLYNVSDQLRAGTLVSVLEDFTRDVGTYRILWPASRHPSPKVRAFVSHMAERLFPQAPEKPSRR
ncbi:LysR family transcriptional regulator [Myxococcaceae bacterium JPH2]|nr:LysR family transcriptional regulator [Myxococcaceae bacterium JPH2]